MNKLKWWFRIVGGFYLLLALTNLYVMYFTDGQAVLAGSPFPVDELVVRVAVDYWSAFAFGMLGTGTFLLWASRDPLKHLSVVWYVVWLEIFSGVTYDALSIARGFDATTFGSFGILHLIIIVTGVMFVRQARVE